MTVFSSGGRGSSIGIENRGFEAPTPSIGTVAQKFSILQYLVLGLSGHQILRFLNTNTFYTFRVELTYSVSLLDI